MTEEKKSYTDSALSDLFKRFFNKFKDNNGSYKYVDAIDSLFADPSTLQINYNDFTDEIKNIFENTNENKLHRTIYGSIVNVSRTKIGSLVESLKTDNQIKFEILNYEKFSSRIFDNDFVPTKDEKTFEMLQKSIPDPSDPITPAKELIEYYLYNEKIISKVELFEKIHHWSSKLGLKLKPKVIKTAINEVFEVPKVVDYALKIASEMGRDGKKICVDMSQHNELAHYFTAKFKIKRIELNGKLYFFNGEFYDHRTEEIIKRESRKCLHRSQKNTVKEIVSHVEDIAEIITSDRIEKDALMICLKNGLYNVQTGKLEPFNPDYFVTGQIPFKYDNSKSFEKIDKVVTEIINDERNKKVYYDFGSTIFLPFTGLTFMLGLLGSTGTGKTPLGELYTIIVGTDNATDTTMHKIADDATTRRDISTKYFQFDEELSNHDIKNINSLKKMIHQERFTDRGIYEHNVSYRPRASLMFASNNIFEISSTEDANAIYERSYLIETKTKFRGRDDEIKHIFDHIIKNDESQAEGFVTFLLNNATKILKEGKIKQKQSAKEVESIWNKFGNRVRKFLENRVKQVKNAFEDRSEWWDAYQEYASVNNWSSGKKTKFYEKVQDILDVEVQQERLESGLRAWGYFGYRLMTDEEIEKHEQTPLFEEKKNKIDIQIDYEL